MFTFNVITCGIVFKKKKKKRDIINKFFFCFFHFNVSRFLAVHSTYGNTLHASRYQWVTEYFLMHMSRSVNGKKQLWRTKVERDERLQNLSVSTIGLLGVCKLVVPGSFVAKVYWALKPFSFWPASMSSKNRVKEMETITRERITRLR